MKNPAADSEKNPHFFPLFYTNTLPQRRRFRGFFVAQNLVKALFSLLFFTFESPRTSEKIGRAHVFQIPPNGQGLRVYGVHFLPKGFGVIKMPQMNKLVHDDVVKNSGRQTD